jgi:hypothetical protein
MTSETRCLREGEGMDVSLSFFYNNTPVMKTLSCSEQYTQPHSVNAQRFTTTQKAENSCGGKPFRWACNTKDHGCGAGCCSSIPTAEGNPNNHLEMLPSQLENRPSFLPRNQQYSIDQGCSTLTLWGPKLVGFLFYLIINCTHLVPQV